MECWQNTIKKTKDYNEDFIYKRSDKLCFNKSMLFILKKHQHNIIHPIKNKVEEL